MRRQFKEKFISPFEETTRVGAQRVLEAIRSAHPDSKGWREIEAYIEALPNGKFRAVRVHEKV